MQSSARWIALGLVVIMGFVSGQGRDLLEAQSEVGQASNWFGAVEAHDAPEQAAELGVTWSRARFHWGSIQPSGPDEWIDAELTDDDLLGEIAAGREVIGLLIGIPEWAQDKSGLPAGLQLPVNDSENLWADFVRTAVERYEGQIDHWVIWNEPDIWDSEHPAYSWSGTEADFARLMEVSYLVIKDVNPEAVVHLGAMSHFWDVLYGRELYFRRLLTVITSDPHAAANNYYYDVATLHLYFNPADVYDILTEYQQIQREFGLDKPFWLVETNAPPSSDPSFIVDNPTFQVSLVEQAAYMPQALSLALAAGSERVGLYKMIDTAGDFAANPELFGLLRADGEPRPGFHTARTAAQLLSDSDVVEWRDSHLVSQVVVRRPDEVLRILWVRVPFSQSVTIPAFSDGAERIDMWGNRRSLSPEGGYYGIHLSAGECTQTVGDYCMIGGPPVFVLEKVEARTVLDHSLDLVVLEDEVGQDFSAIALPLRQSPVLIVSVMASLCIMLGVVWLSRRLRLQFT